MVKEKGFTLIEILVVIGILFIIVVIGSTSFFNLLRGSTKTKTVSLIKQNGDYALGVMERMIRNARGISVCNVGMDSIGIKNPDSYSTIFSCVDNPISSNSAKLISDQVKVVGCYFDCQKGGPLQPDVVTIGFTLSQAQVTTRPEEQAMINFKTIVNLRNITE